ncbi:hypothetical protein [Actinomadura sp. 3N407]|uniref:hypothetical protein n=1 Tax=Actinomadura sp. 3N407 TaxID=3457423 RepID=UPI003FCE6657
MHHKRPRLPAELQYIRSVVQDRWQRAKNARAQDTGMETLEIIILAAFLAVAAAAVGAFLVTKINSYMNKIN